MASKQRNHLKFLTGVASLALVCAVPSLGWAQQAAPQAEEVAEEDEEIVVVGFRQSLANSVNTKRTNSSIVEVVTAEEVGKLPDISIAESLGRLPGLSTQRLSGRSNVLSIRGLGPDFSTALLNGREQVTTSDNRGVEFDQYPAELLSGAVVYKTPYAGLIGQGLAGTVDLQTIRPLSLPDRVLSFSARYEFNEQGSLNPDAPFRGFRATGTYADQFFNNTLGFAIGVAAQSSPTQTERFNAWGYAGSGTNTDPFIIGGQNSRVNSNDLNRIGGFTTVQWAPTARFETTIDAFYTDFNEDNVTRGIETPLAFGGGFGVSAPVITAVEDGFVTAGSFSNVRGVVRNDINLRRAELFSTGINTKYLGDRWTLEFDGSYSRATRRDELIESYAGTGFGPTGGAADTFSFAQFPGAVPSFAARLDYTDTNLIRLTDPLGWGGAPAVQAGFINAPSTADQLFHLKAAVTRDLDFGFIKNVQIGGDYGDRRKTRDIRQVILTLSGPGTGPGTTFELPIPQEALIGENTGLEFLGFPQQVTFDPLFLLENVYIPVETALSSFATPQSWRVDENVITGWIKFDLEGDLGGVGFQGNAGVQVVHTDQSSNGGQVLTIGAPVIVGISDGIQYTNFLPTLNLNFDITDSFRVRLGAGRALARARLDQLSASRSLGVNLTALAQTDPFGPQGTAFSVSGGNPLLRPYISNQVDLSFEKYFGGAGYIAFALFYKDLQDFVNTGDAFITDFTAEADAILSPEQRAILGSTLGFSRAPTNLGAGRIRGAEFTASIPLDLISQALDGFGFITSASWTDSRVTLGSSTDPTVAQITTIPGFSRWVVNSTLYFEKGGFEARLSHRFRTSFLGELAAISATRAFRSSRAESIIDGQIGYAFSGKLDGLRITAQGLNLTDEPFQTFQGGDNRQLIDSESFGRSFLLGASYTF
jgi:iron complex outermembrane receptor protein